MAFQFIGGEDHDFVKIGNCAVDTSTTAARRSANARCSLRVGGIGSAVTDGWQQDFAAAISSFWFTARFYVGSLATVSAGTDFLTFLDGSTRRLLLVNDGSNRISIVKQTGAGVRTTLATSVLAMSAVTLYKLDVQVNGYGPAAVINVYLDGMLWVTYTGDAATDSSTQLSGFCLGHMGADSSTVYWSEIICGTDDTRSMSLVTLPPAANGNTFAWTNSYASIDEITTDDADLCASDTADQVAQTTVTSTGLTGTPGILAVCVSARAQHGSSGPTKLQLGLRVNGGDYFSADKTLAASFARAANIWESNPNTAASWSHTDLKNAGFNIGVKSIA